MRIIVNGQPRDVPDRITVADLLNELTIKSEHVAIELNRELVPRKRHPDRSLAAGDCVEIVTLVGGG